LLDYFHRRLAGHLTLRLFSTSVTSLDMATLLAATESKIAMLFLNTAKGRKSQLRLEALAARLRSRLYRGFFGFCFTCAYYSNLTIDKMVLEKYITSFPTGCCYLALIRQDERPQAQSVLGTFPTSAMVNAYFHQSPGHYASGFFRATLGV